MRSTGKLCPQDECGFSPYFRIPVRPRPPPLHGQEAVRGDRDRIDAAFDEKSREFRMVARRLAAEADLARRASCASRDDARRSSTSPPRPARRTASASSSESRSTPSVSWVRSLLPIEKPSKRSANSLGQDDVRGDLAHHIDLQARSRRAEAVLRHDSSTRSASSGDAAERDHDDDVAEARSPRAAACDRPAFEREAFAVARRVVARAPRKPIIGFSSVGSNARAADQVGIFVGLEVAHPHDDRLRVIAPPRCARARAPGGRRNIRSCRRSRASARRSGALRGLVLQLS